MTALEKHSEQLAKTLTLVARQIYYLEAATEMEVKMAVMSFLGDLYDYFDAQIPAGTALPYRRD